MQRGAVAIGGCGDGAGIWIGGVFLYSRKTEIISTSTQDTGERHGGKIGEIA